MTALEQLRRSADAISAVCRQYHVRELSVFGSIARGEAGPRSDVDLLVAFESNAPVTLFTLFDLQSELSRVIGRHVDLVPKDGLKPALRSDVLRDARVLYAA